MFARRLPLAGLFVVLLLLTAACADSAGSAVGSGSTADPDATAEPAEPGTDADDTVSSPPNGICDPEVTEGCDDVPVDPDAGDCPPEGCTAWQETAIVDTEGTPRARGFESFEAVDDTLVVRWWSGVEPCTALADVKVEETDTTVTVTVFEASIHPDEADVACIEIAQAKQHTITLAAPVGDREVIDGGAGQ